MSDVWITHGAQTYLGHVDGGDGVRILEASAVDEDEAAEEGLVGTSGRGDEAGEELYAEGSREALLAVGADALEDDGGGHVCLDGGELGGGEELAGAEVGERGPGDRVEADDAAVEGDGGALVGLGGEGAGEAVAGEGHGGGADGDAVGVAADDGAVVLLGDMLLRLLGAEEDVVGLLRG